jgi:hypothetical protein
MVSPCYFLIGFFTNSAVLLVAEGPGQLGQQQDIDDTTIFHYPSFMPLGEPHYSNYRRWIHVCRAVPRTNYRLQDLKNDIAFTKVAASS